MAMRKGSIGIVMRFVPNSTDFLWTSILPARIDKIVCSFSINMLKLIQYIDVILGV